MTDPAGLLTVQELDNAIVALRHRMANLPERQALDELTGRIAEVQARRDAEVAPRLELERDQRRLEDQLAAVRAKSESEDKRLYSGTVTAPRELQAITDELAALARRSAELEDQILELMVRIEPMAEASAGLDAELARLEAEATAATVTVAEAEASLAAELRDHIEKRAAAAASVESADLARYEQLRPALSPAVVVRLVGANCEGCPSRMPSVEVDRIRHQPPGLVDCEECGRLVLH
jgi:uncharacterized protein